MSLLPEIKSTYQHFKAADYAPLKDAKPALSETLSKAAYGDPEASFTEKRLPGYNHKDTFGVLAKNGPDAYTLTVVTDSGRKLATAALESGNDLFDNWG